MHHDDEDDFDPARFALNARVHWTDNGQKFDGVVAAHVNPGELPSFRRFPQLFKRVCEDGPRLRESCVVVAHGVAHWPDPGSLKAGPSPRMAPASPRPARAPLAIRPPAPQPIAFVPDPRPQPARPALPPGSGSRTKMLLSERPTLKAAFYPVWPHTTEPFGPIFVGHFDGEAVTAHVMLNDDKRVELVFVRDTDGKTIAHGRVRMRKNGADVEVRFRNGKRGLLTATHAAAEMLPRALGLHRAPSMPMQHAPILATLALANA